MNIQSFIRSVSDFPKPGIMFRDIAPLLGNPAGFQFAVDSIAQEWSGKIDAVVALDARGFLFGTPVALALKVPFVPVRKAGKLPGETIAHTYHLEYGSDTVEMQQGSISNGMRVLVVDDLLATGGTAHAACVLIEKMGGTVSGCAFVIELTGLGGREKLSGRVIQALTMY